MAEYKVIAKQSYGQGEGIDDYYYDDILVYDGDCFKTGSRHSYDTCTKYVDYANSCLNSLGFDDSYQNMNREELISYLYDYCILDDDDIEYIEEEDMDLNEIIDTYEKYLIQRMENDFDSSDVYNILGFVCEQMEKEFGGIWDYETIRGSVQGEFAYIIYKRVDKYRF